MSVTWKWLIFLGGAGLIAYLFLRSNDMGSDDGSETPEETAKIDQMVPEAAEALRQLRSTLLGQGIKTCVGQTLRTAAQESAAVASGASATHNSWHLLGRAVDLYPFDPETGTCDLKGVNTDLFKTMQDAASNVGFTNIAFNADGSKRYITTSKGQIWDGGHMQFTEGMTFAQAQANATEQS